MVKDMASEADSLVGKVCQMLGSKIEKSSPSVSDSFVLTHGMRLNIVSNWEKDLVQMMFYKKTSHIDLMLEEHLGHWLKEYEQVGGNVFNMSWWKVLAKSMRGKDLGKPDVEDQKRGMLCLGNVSLDDLSVYLDFTKWEGDLETSNSISPTHWHMQIVVLDGAKGKVNANILELEESTKNKLLSIVEEQGINPLYVLLNSEVLQKEIKGWDRVVLEAASRCLWNWGEVVASWEASVLGESIKGTITDNLRKPRI